MRKKKNKELTAEEIKEFNEKYKQFVTENFVFGRKVSLKRDFYGIKKGTDGLVIDTWPTTSILFRGYYNDMMMSIELSECLDLHEILTDEEFDEYYYVLSVSSDRKVNRKVLYSE